MFSSLAIEAFLPLGLLPINDSLRPAKLGQPDPQVRNVPACGKG
jgi:hypothetical protein